MRRLKRTLAVGSLAVASLLLAACSTVEVSSDFQPGVNLKAYKTFEFERGRGGASPFLRSRVCKAVADQLEARGLKETKVEPQLVVSVKARVDTRTRYDTYTFGYGWWWGWWGLGAANSFAHSVPVGTVLVELLDASTAEPVWQGRIADLDVSGLSGAERTRQVEQAVAKLFGDFPS
jgi:hypothetical protein